MARRIQCDTIAQNNGNSISESATATDENKNERPIDSSGERKSINFGGKKNESKTNGDEFRWQNKRNNFSFFMLLFCSMVPHTLKHDA